MNFEKIKNFGKNLLSGNLQQNQKIFVTISIGWVIFIGYLTWWNGLRNPGIDKGFRWDEWFWFGIVPAFAPYLFFSIWKRSNSDQ